MPRFNWKPEFWNSHERGPNGRLLCRVCGQEVPKGRQRWCSRECVQLYKIKNDPATARQAVWERDKGICQVCGLHIALIENLFQALRSGPMKPPGMLNRVWSKVDPYDARWKWNRNDAKEFIEKELGIKFGGQGHLWEMDHIVPVVEGGSR